MHVFLIELIVNLERLKNIDIVKFGFTPVTFLGIIYKWHVCGMSKFMKSGDRDHFEKN